MTEFELIATLTARLPTNDFVVTGAGDDCGVLELGSPATQTLFKADAVIIPALTRVPIHRMP